MEAQLQGREEALDMMLQGLHQDSYIRIDWITRERMEVDAKQKGFTVRYPSKYKMLPYDAHLFIMLSHSSSRNPGNAPCSVMRSGRFTSIPSVARS